MNLTTLGILAIFYLHYAFDCLGTKISKSILKTDNLHYNTSNVLIERYLHVVV